MAMQVEDIVRVKIAGMERAVFLPQDLHSKTDDNRTYVKLAKARSEINRLLGQPLKAKGPNKRKLQFTSIIETLIQARDAKVKTIVDSRNSQSVKLDLGIDDPIAPKKEKYQRSTWSRRAEVIDSLPTNFDILAPAVGMVGSCLINVLVAKQAAMPLYVELTQTTIDYLRSVVAEQILQGDIHRKRTSVPDDQKVQVPDGFSYSYTKKKMVFTRQYFSPTTRKRKVQTTFHNLVSYTTNDPCSHDTDHHDQHEDGDHHDEDEDGNDSKCEDSSELEEEFVKD